MIKSHQTTEPLTHAGFKVVRAKDHVAHLEEICRNFFPKLAHQTTVDRTPEGKTVLRVSVPDNSMIVGIPLDIGDCVHNLRSSLDHAITEICLRCVPNWKDDDRLLFPYDITEQSLRNRVKHLEKTYGLPSDFGKVITDTIRPWRDGHSVTSASYALWAVSKLDNADKHKFLTPSITIATVSGICGYYTNGIAKTGTMTNTTAHFVAGTSMLLVESRDQFILTDPGRADYGLAFQDEQLFPDMQVVPTLKELLKLYTHTIMTLATHLKNRP
jgi:hypothetical protein